jgi:vacuolar iron transporter family protein
MSESPQRETDGPRAEIHHRHRDVTGGWLRPAVFGVMDGLVSNLGLIAGVAGGRASASTVALAGLAGLVAGSFSMAAGEYVSVASPSALALAEIEVERRELRRAPEAEQAELAQLYVSRGIDPELAGQVAAQLSRDPERALHVHVREELGVDVNDLPSPLLAATSSFGSFAVGALIPLLPYLLGVTSLWVAVSIALLGLFVAGAVVSRVTARAWWYSGTRQLLLGAAAAAVTYLIGTLVNVGLT